MLCVLPCFSFLFFLTLHLQPAPFLICCLLQPFFFSFFFFFFFCFSPLLVSRCPRRNKNRMTLFKTSSVDAVWASGCSQLGVARAGCNPSLFQNVWWLSVPNACLVCLQPPGTSLQPPRPLARSAACLWVCFWVCKEFPPPACSQLASFIWQLLARVAEMVSDPALCHSWFCRPLPSLSGWLLTCLKSCLLRYSLYGSHSWLWASLSRSLSWFYMSFKDGKIRAVYSFQRVGDLWGYAVA